MKVPSLAPALALVTLAWAGALSAQEQHGAATPTPDVIRIPAYDVPASQSEPLAGPTGGFADDIMKAVARRAGLELRYVPVPAGEETILALEGGIVDVIPNVAPSPARELRADFSQTVYVSQVRIFVRAGTSSISDAESLVGRRVARVNLAGGRVDIPGMMDTTFATPEGALGALVGGHVDAMIYPQSMMWNLATGLGLQGFVKSVGPPLVELPRALAVREGNDSLLARLNPAIDALLADPEYAEIVRRWFADPPPYWTVTRVLTWAAVVLLLLVIGHHARVWHLNQRLVRSRDQLRALTAHLQTTREEEQRTLARELHDELGQVMAVLKMDLRELREDHSEPAALDERYNAMVAIADSAIQVGRNICTRLRPDILDRLGLEPAVDWAAEDFRERTGLTCRVEGLDSGACVEDGASTAFFRILQESLSNVIRHAQASEVVIRLGLSSDPQWMEVEDDGQGATRAELDRPDALGLLGMRERAAALGGRTTVRTRPGRGTLVRVEIPRRAPVQAQAIPTMMAAEEGSGRTLNGRART